MYGLKRIVSTRLSLCICIGVLFFTQACREDTILNGAVVPIDDTINTRIIPDTITILTGTTYRDTLLTSINIAGVPIQHGLGTINTDPYTGKTNAAIYFQVVPPALNYQFPAYPDSAMLILPYGGFTWGDTNSLIVQNFHVYEVKDSFNVGIDYYSNTDIAVDRSNLLGSTTISSYQSLKDSVWVNGQREVAHLRIPLNQSLIQRIKEGADIGTNFSSYSAFVNWFRGFCIEPAPGNAGNALFYFRLDGSTLYSNAGLVFYYTQPNTDSVKTISFGFNASYNAHANRISRDYSGTPIEPLLQNTAHNDSFCVIQNLPGTGASFKFPFLKNFEPAPVLRAELIITQYSFAGDQSDIYFLPQRLYPTGINANGEEYTILDRYPITSSEPLSFIDGTLRTVTIGSTTISQYILNIPREVQKTITEQRDILHLRINGASGFPGAYRLIAGGSGQSNNLVNVKLKLVFSKTK
jgi:hypothetical protein